MLHRQWTSRYLTANRLSRPHNQLHNVNTISIQRWRSFKLDHRILPSYTKSSLILSCSHNWHFYFKPSCFKSRYPKRVVYHYLLNNQIQNMTRIVFILFLFVIYFYVLLADITREKKVVTVSISFHHRHISWQKLLKLTKANLISKQAKNIQVICLSCYFFKKELKGRKSLNIPSIISVSSDAFPGLAGFVVGL